MGGIFISYRRSDVSGYARALHERLAKRFGPARIFMDIDSIEPGLDFVEVIEEALGSSIVVLVLIGRRWYQPDRLQAPQDLVRLEIAMALDRRMRVIPIFFEGAGMPSAEELPDSIRALTRRNAVDISDLRFDYDVGRLADFLARIVDSPAPAVQSLQPEPETAPPKTVAGVAEARAEESETRPASSVAQPGSPASPTNDAAGEESVRREVETPLLPEGVPVANGPEIELRSIPKSWARRRALRKTAKLLWLGVPLSVSFIIAVIGYNISPEHHIFFDDLAFVDIILTFILLPSVFLAYLYRIARFWNGNAAIAMLRTGQRAEAEAALKWLISHGRQTRHAWAYGVLGTLYSQQGHYAIAEEAFRRSESLAPMEEWIQRNRAINAGLASSSA